MNTEDLKLIVREKYAEIAKNSLIKVQYSCCGNSNCCEESDFSMIGDEYTNVAGHNADADLGLGCGIPTQYADIQVGYSVLDLGSGAGNDCFVARAIVGETGKVTGIDFTDAMTEKARANNAKLGYSNVEFIQGDIEEMPFSDNQFDVIVSNCVLNLVPDKQKAFSEMYRVLKPRGRLVLSDPTCETAMPENLKTDDRLRALCLSGAMPLKDYITMITDVGFGTVEIRAKRPYRILDPLNYKTDELIYIESVEVCAIKDSMPEDGPCVFTGKTAIYYGTEDFFDDKKGHTLLKNQPLSICDKTANALNSANREDIFISESTFFYDGGGCC